MVDLRKQIPGFPDYCVTKDGKVWSSKRGKGKWLCFMKVGKGYFAVSLYKNNKHHQKRVHSLVLETFIGPKPKNMEGRHLDGNKENNKLDNLCWGTGSENSYDAVKHGTSPGFMIKGEDVNTAKLTEQDVRLIIDCYYDGAYTQTELAEYFNVLSPTICSIVHKRNWKHIWAQKGGDITNKQLCIK